MSSAGALSEGLFQIPRRSGNDDSVGLLLFYECDLVNRAGTSEPPGSVYQGGYLACVRVPGVEVQELEDLLRVYFEGDVVQDSHMEFTPISLQHGDLICRNQERPLRVLDPLSCENTPGSHARGRLRANQFS